MNCNISPLDGLIPGCPTGKYFGHTTWNACPSAVVPADLEVERFLPSIIPKSLLHGAVETAAEIFFGIARGNYQRDRGISIRFMGTSAATQPQQPASDKAHLKGRLFFDYYSMNQHILL